MPPNRSLIIILDIKVKETRMISSMTGFGRFEQSNTKCKLTVELKSVNHKYLDVNIRLPRKFNAFEAEIRNILKAYASRGKIDIYISYENLEDAGEVLKYNKELAGEYLNYYKMIRDDLGLEGDISISNIARSPEVLVLEEQEIDEQELWDELRPVLEGAFALFASSRSKEGEALKNNIILKLDEMDGHVAFLEERLPMIVEQYKARLKDRMKDFLEEGKIDEGRIAAEVTIYADKIAIDEEMVRLSTHIRHMRDVLDAGRDIGRNLDFIAQEMNREANTILSKSNDIEITNRGIELKTCIEKIREQVQNIE